jgi:peptidoglycan/xylan/chitin deacetylase (PgdA/CDA1 family)
VDRVGKLISTAKLEMLAASGAPVLLRALRRVTGVIMKVQRVRPARPRRFRPNRALEITPAFLDAVIAHLRRRKVEIVSLDEMHSRLLARDTGKGRFVSFTCDGGYADLRQWALPVFRKHGAPFAVFVPTAFADRIGELWWLVLEAVIAKTDRLALLIDGQEQTFDCTSAAEKNDLFAQLSSWLWARPTNDDISRAIHDLAGRYGVNIATLCAGACMGWDDVAALAADPLVTIGAQTVNHPILAKLPDAKVRTEMAMSRAVIESAIGIRPDYFAYPFGQKDAAGPREFAIAGELGFKAAFTSRAGALGARHGTALMELPRVSLSGEFQRPRYLPVLMAGIGVAGP